MTTDKHAQAALAAANDAEQALAGLTGEQRRAISAAVRQLRWVVESRARWMDACNATQRSVFEEQEAEAA
jgi:transposase